jgi:prepilin-type N-terminal cleavage/methylation domain-containing protein
MYVKNKTTKAFSMIEILVAICIIGLLIGVAAYTYPQYTARSQVTAAMHILDQYVHAAQNYYIENSTMPSSMVQIGGNYSTNSGNDIVSNVTLTTTASSISISASFSSTSAAAVLRGNSLNLQLNVSSPGASSNGMFSITCTATNIANTYLPTTCQK